MDKDVHNPEVENVGAKESERESLLGGYTAFQKWEYDKIFYPEAHPKSWLDIAESFYRASLHQVEGVAEHRLSEDIEGIAPAFLFRHYLELALRTIRLSWHLEEELKTLCPIHMGVSPQRLKFGQTVHVNPRIR